MRTRTRLLSLLVAGLAAGCASYEPIDVRVIAIEPAESTALEQRMKIGLRIVNPNDREIAATGMSLNFIVNGKPLARGVSNAPITVPPLSEAVTEITVGTSLFDIARQLLAMDSHRGDLSYGIDGRIHLGGLRPPIHFEKSGTLAPSQRGSPRSTPTDPVR